MWWKRKSLEERVKAQKIKQERYDLRMWDTLVEPYLVSAGYSVKNINEYHKMYVEQPFEREQIRDACRYRGVHLPPTPEFREAFRKAREQVDASK